MSDRQVANANDGSESDSSDGHHDVDNRSAACLVDAVADEVNSE